MPRLMTLMTFVLVAACASPPAPSSTREAPAAPDKEAASAALERANALLADLAKREEEIKKVEAARAAKANDVPVVIEQTPAAPPVSRLVDGGLTSGEAEPTPATPTYIGGKDEATWKAQMRALDIRLQEDQANFAAAMSAISATAGPPVTTIDGRAAAQESYDRARLEAERYQTAVERDRAAIERFREDARRAGVPPGWLRWP